MSGSNQDRATQHYGTHARLIAGPGTGKTETLIRRVQHLITDRGVPAGQLLALTFTDATGRELRERLSTLAPPLPQVPDARTLHSFAFRELRRRSGSAFVGLRVLDTWEEVELLCVDLGRRVGRTAAQVRKLLVEYDAAWRTLEEPPTDAFRSRFEAEIENLRRVYDFALRGELVYKFKRLLDSDPGYQPELLHLLIDEYQDLNRCDLTVISELSKRAGAFVYIAGDDDQCIYRFRHADPSGFRSFVAEYAGATDYGLELCYRCGAPILEAALTLIAHGEDRIEKNIQAVHAEGEVEVLSFRSVQAQYRGVARLVAEHLAAGVLPREILILVPRRSFATHYISALTAYGIPGQNVADAEGLFEDLDARRLLYAIRHAKDPDDAVALRGWLRCASGVGPGTVAKAVARSAETGEPFAAACRNADDPRLNRALEALAAYQASLSTRENLESEITALVGRRVLSEHGADVLRRVGAPLYEEEPPPAATTDDEQPSAGDESAEPEDSALVRVTTFRKAKGLSAAVVIVTDLDDDIVPADHTDISEERRLLYVSMTRARRNLYLTHVTYRHGHTSYAAAEHRASGPYRRRSRFLDEVGIPSRTLPDE